MWTYVINSWIVSWWALSLVAESALLIRSVSWRRTYPRFTAYLAFDLAASVALFWISCYHPFMYDYVWRTAQVLLIAGRVALVNESYLALKSADRMDNRTRAWRPPITTILCGSVLGGSILHVVLAHPLVWPASALEPIFALIGLSNVVMGCVLLGILSTTTTPIRAHTEYRHAALLSVYLLLTSAAYYAAARTIDRVGAALMIIAAVTYVAWAVVMSEPKGSLGRPIEYLRYPRRVKVRTV